MPLQASDTSQGNGGKTSEAANGADLEEALETSEGRPRLRRRTSGFLGADRGEVRHSHSPGAVPFLWNKRVPGTHWPQGGAPHDRPAPCSRPPGCVQVSVPTRRSTMSVYTHRGKKARAYSAPHAQNQSQIKPSLSGMGT